MSSKVPKAAVILAAGRGSRLAEIASPYTKTILEVAGRPIIGYGARAVEPNVDCIVVVGHPTTGELAAEAVRRSLTKTIPVVLALQKTPRGMADAMRIGFEALPEDMAAVVIAGDNIILEATNIQRVLAALGTEFPGRQAVAMAWTYLEHDFATARHFSVFRPLSSATGELIEKPAVPPSRLCWCGPVAFASSAEALRRVAKLTPSKRGELEGPDLMNTYLKEGRGRHLPLTGHWFDVGTPAALAEAEKIISQSRAT